MIRYSVQPIDQNFVKGYRFLSFPKNMGKNIGQLISKTLLENTAKNVLIMLKNLPQVCLKLL